MRSKITVIGAGFVGSTLVQRLAERDYADVVMFDIIPNMPQGKALDLLQAGPVLGYDSLVVGTNDYAETANSDIVVITSGFPRKPGMTRDDLVKKNQEIVSQVTQEVVKHSPNCIIIPVSSSYQCSGGSWNYASELKTTFLSRETRSISTPRCRTLTEESVKSRVPQLS